MKYSYLIIALLNFCSIANAQSWQNTDLQIGKILARYKPANPVHSRSHTYGYFKTHPQMANKSTSDFGCKR